MEIQLFNSPQFGNIRTAGTADKPEFCLADVCAALKLDTANVRRRLSDGVCTVHPTVDALGRTQPNTYINEDGLYDVILDSRKPEARAFRKWITSEVIPSIRKTGGYIPTSAEDTPAEIMAKALLIADKTMKEQKQRIQALEGEKDLLSRENMLLAPKAKYTDDVLQSVGTMTFTELAKELDFRSVRALMKRLLEDKIMFKQGDRYLPYAKYSGLGFFASRTYPFVHADGRPDTSSITVITEKGRAFLHKHFNVPDTPVSIEDIMMEGM